MGNPSTLGEGKAFLRDTTGRVKCVVGMGRVVPTSSIDAVFVARHPNTHRHAVVGLCFKPSFSYSDWQNPKGRIETWAEASTTDVEELLSNRRPAVDWPQGRSMRRWTRRSGRIFFGALQAMRGSGLKAHNNLGDAYHAQGKPNPAVACYEAFARLAPPQDAAYVEKVEEAIRQLRQSM